jgi:hypothetical protein
MTSETPVAGAAPSGLDRALTPVMVWLSLVHLTLVAAILPQAGQTDYLIIGAEGEANGLSGPLAAVVTAICLFWLPFWIECGLSLLVYRRRWNRRRIAHALLVAAVPALRIGLRPTAEPERIWVPTIGWSETGRGLIKRLDRIFGPPMMLIALMILPILGLEFIWTEPVERHEWLAATVDLGTRVIWFAFVVEFVVMVSAHDRKLRYCTKNWVDLAIIALPFVSFLRVMRLARLGKLSSLQKISRVYRLRGLAFKLMRAVTILRYAERMSEHYARRRLEGLKDRLAEREEELAELRAEIAKMESEMATVERAEAEATAQSALEAEGALEAAEGDAEGAG